MTTAEQPRVLVINAGSSSLKYQLIEPVAGAVEANGLIERVGEPGPGRRSHSNGGHTTTGTEPVADPAGAFDVMLRAFADLGPDLAAAPPVAVGHRVVHGGAEFSEATLIDDQVLTAVRRLNPLAPLHNPANVTGIELAVSRFPGVPQVAVFDTAFHRSIPRPAFTYAVPREWQDRYGVRRYGFHGTSHRYVSERAVQMLGGTAGLGLVVLHLGNGASACAVLDGRSIETSMGLTPLEGLVMGTRSGDIDPSIAGHLARNAGMTAGQIDHALNHDSGLLGLAGANDFRTLTEQAAAGDPAARLAIEVTSHRLVKYVGAYAAVLGRLDGVVFTGGIGEHSALLRARVLGGLGVFGMRLDEQANAAAGVTAGGEQRVSHRRSAVAALVIPTREELQIARECLALLASG